MSPINTAYKGDFLVVDDQPGRVARAGDRRRLPRPAGPGRAPSCRCSSGWSCCARAADGRARPVAAVGDPRRADGRARRASPTASRTPGPTTPGSCSPRAPPGRSKGVIKQNAADYFSARSAIEAMAVAARRARPRTCATRPTSRACRSSTPTPRCCAPIPALLAGARVAYVERFSGTPLLAAGDRRGRHDVQRHRRDPLLPVEPAAVAARPGAPGAHDLGRAGAEGHLPRVRGALRRAPHRGLRPHRDRRRHDDGPDPAAAAGQLRHRQPGLRGHDRRAGHRPAAAARTPRARSWWT